MTRTKTASSCVEIVLVRLTNPHLGPSKSRHSLLWTPCGHRTFSVGGRCGNAAFWSCGSLFCDCSEGPLPALFYLNRYRAAALLRRSGRVVGCSSDSRFIVSIWLSSKSWYLPGWTSDAAARDMNSPRICRSSMRMCSARLVSITSLGRTPEQFSCGSLAMTLATACQRSCVGQRARLLSVVGQV